MARKAPRKRAPKAEKKKSFSPADFVFPGERQSYWTGIVMVAIVFIWIAGVLYFTVKQPSGKPAWWIPREVLAWPVVALLVANALAAGPRKKELKKVGRQAKVMNTNHPELYNLLSRQASLLGLAKAPDMYLVDDEQPVLFSIPGGRASIILSKGLRDVVSDDELAGLLAHELTHIRLKHVRLELAMVFIQAANPVVKVLLLPVTLLSLFSRAWKDLIDFTADRGAVLVTLKPATVNAAIVKFAAAADPNASVTQADLHSYLESKGDIQTDAAQLERHFKVGQFVSSQPNLRERIEQISDFVRSEDGQNLMRQMADLQGVSHSEIAISRSSSGDDSVEYIQEEMPD